MGVPPKHSSVSKRTYTHGELAAVDIVEAPFSPHSDRERAFCSVAGQFAECMGEACAYQSSCPRRLIARLKEFGPYSELRTLIVLPTEHKGNALFALTNMCKGHVISVYSGIEFSKQKANERRSEIEAEGLTTYHMNLCRQTTVLEASVCGTASRFASHACKGVANAYPLRWSCEGTYYVCLVADRAILAGEEITYEYNMTMVEADIDNFEKKIKCRCGGGKLCSKIMGYSISEVEEVKALREERRKSSNDSILVLD